MNSADLRGTPPPIRDSVDHPSVASKRRSIMLFTLIGGGLVAFAVFVVAIYVNTADGTDKLGLAIEELEREAQRDPEKERRDEEARFRKAYEDQQKTAREYDEKMAKMIEQERKKMEASRED